MKKYWLIVGALAVLLGVAQGVKAMPTEPRTAAHAPAPAPVYDIRPFLKQHPLPPAALALKGGGTTRYFHPHQAMSNTYMVDDFEAPSLNDALWPLIYDLNGSQFGEYFWALSSCQSAKPGHQSLWAIGGGAQGASNTCGVVYPNGVASSAIMLLNLKSFPSPQVLDLSYDFYLNTRTEELEGVAPDGLFLSFLWDNPDTGERERIVIDAITSQFPNRFFTEPRVIDLLHVKELYAPYREFNLYDIGNVKFEFLMMSKMAPGGELPEGVFIDNIEIHSDVPPTEVPPTEVTPMATDTETPVGPEMTDTPTPTETMGGPTDTPTDTPVPGETTAVPEDTATPTATELVSDTPTPTATRQLPPKPLYLPIADK